MILCGMVVIICFVEHTTVGDAVCVNCEDMFFALSIQNCFKLNCDGSVWDGCHHSLCGTCNCWRCHMCQL